jgi:D-serine deaminase-like pyridoxal phosphate-dependent protein
VLDQSGYQGALAYSLAEAVWLARSGIQDILLAYPSVDRDAIVDVAQDDQLRESIMVMVDSIEQCDLIANTAGPNRSRCAWTSTPHFASVHCT